MSESTPFPDDGVPKPVSPELRGLLQELWVKVLNEPKRPGPEFVLVGRLNKEDSVLIKLAGGDEAHCRSEAKFLRERDPELWTDYEVIPFQEFKALYS